MAWVELPAWRGNAAADVHVACELIHKYICNTLHFITPDKVSAHQIQWWPGTGTFCSRRNSIISRTRELLFSQHIFIYCLQDPRCGGEPALLAHPPLPVARGTRPGEPGMRSPAFRRLGEGQREEEEQRHPSPVWPVGGTEETGGPAPALSPIQEEPCTEGQQVCSTCCTPAMSCSKEAESSNTNPSAWLQGSLFGRGAWGIRAGRDVPLYWSGHRSMCIPRECSRLPSVLKQFVLAHICACHKSILLLKASCSHCSSHTGSQGAVLQNCMQKCLASSLKSIFCNRFICNGYEDIFTAKYS